MGKKPNRLLSNKEIVYIKLATACMLFLAGSMFFFGNFNHGVEEARDAFRANLFHPMLLLFYLGNALVALYVILVMIKLWDKEFASVDRFDLAYRIIFSITLIAMGLHDFFTYPYMMLPLGVMMLGILSGVLMWATPKLVDNDNEVF